VPLRLEGRKWSLCLCTLRTVFALTATVDLFLRLIERLMQDITADILFLQYGYETLYA